MIANDKYSLLNRDNLAEPNQMHLSHKQKCYFDFFEHNLNLHKI